MRSARPHGLLRDADTDDPAQLVGGGPYDHSDYSAEPLGEGASGPQPHPSFIEVLREAVLD